MIAAAYRAPSDPGMSYPCFVDPEPPDRYRAPPGSGGSSRERVPNPGGFPRVDDQLVRPETREELVRGRMVLAVPAKEQHGDRHHTVDYLTGGCIAPGYVGSVDLLTRVGSKSDFATDTCIRREGIDPATGSRYLEELVFEIVNEQSMSDITERAEDLSTRGVRRIIAIFVKKNEVGEWSPERNDWLVLDPKSALEDRTLAQPIPIRALLDRAEADNAVVRALRAKKNPEILAVREEGVREGREEGRTVTTKTAIEAVCEVLEIPLDPERRALLLTLDATKLETLLYAIRKQRRWP
jgi:hypothetical protein